jgi:hypothetical protein
MQDRRGSSTMNDGLPLQLFPGRFGMCKLAPTELIPARFLAAAPCFIARTADELSIVAPLPLTESSSGSFRLIGIELTFGTTETGILRRLVDPLAEASVWVLALGTHDTDHVLVREDQLAHAVAALRRAGHSIKEPM